MKTINLVWWRFDPDSSYEYDWLNSLLSDFEVNHIIEDDTYPDRAVIVANLNQIFFSENGSRQRYNEELNQFRRYIQGFKIRGLKVGLIHLNDELYKESTGYYKDLNFVFRQYYKEEDHKRYKNCHHLALGYKSSFTDGLVRQPISKREYFWSFAGQLKGSRYEMAKYADRIPGGKFHTTNQWNDPNGLTTKEYAALLNNTVFSLCPMGNYSVDCYRIYEALEAGAIPIIEAKGIQECLSVLFNPQLVIKYGIWDPKFWLRNYQYWEKAYSPEFPCPLIYNWKDLGMLISSIDVESASEKIQLWWKGYKRSLTRSIQATIEETFA
ncbi:MAG: hypothetical protein WCA35_13640 [Kovacikia sp.]